MRHRRDQLIPQVEELHRTLQRSGATLATAESLTGGRLASWWTRVPGSSATFRGGLVAYASDVKVSVLGVPAELVEQHGVVSAECARAMAVRIRELLGSTYGVSTTGVAGPDPQEGHRPGTVFVGVAGPDGAHAVALELPGDRERVQESTCRHAVEALAATVR